MRLPLLLMILVVAYPRPDDGVAGQVVAPDGKPLADALVVTQRFFKTGGYDEVKGQSDENGRFTLAFHGKILFVRKEGFVPLTHILRVEDRDLTLQLKPLSDENIFKIPKCADVYHADGEALVQGKRKPKGIVLLGAERLLPVPDGTHIEHSSDTDYSTYIIHYPKHKKEQMIRHSGPLWGAYFPFVHVLKDVAQVKDRALSTDENAAEIRGILAQNAVGRRPI